MTATEQVTQGKILCFGELLMRISPDVEGKWLDKQLVPIFIGGAELNVATALARWQVRPAYLTALPENELSAQILARLDTLDIDCSKTISSGSRIGLYYLTGGKDLKNEALIYDRAHSSFSELTVGMIDWDAVFQGVKLFYFTAICPAISQNLADVCQEAIDFAKARNIRIALDLNYRSKLWQYGKSPASIIPAMASGCDLIMGNLWAAEIMLDIPVLVDIHRGATRLIYLREALKSSQQIQHKYPHATYIANTFRLDNNEGIHYFTSLFSKGEMYISKEYITLEKVNKVGSGDCFMAGLLYGIYNGWQPQAMLDFATAAAFEKLFCPGDSIERSVEEIRLKI